MVRQTSIDAYHQIRDNELLSKRRLEVYEVLYKYGPATASELSERLPGKLSRTIGSNVHARLGELRDMHVAQETGTRICSESGHRGILWDVTKSLPVKKLKKITNAQKVIRARRPFKYVKQVLNHDDWSTVLSILKGDIE